jgi:hypothetical protein
MLVIQRIVKHFILLVALRDISTLINLSVIESVTISPTNNALIFIFVTALQYSVSRHVPLLSIPTITSHHYEAIMTSHLTLRRLFITLHCSVRRFTRGVCNECGHSAMQHFCHFNKHILNPIGRSGETMTFFNLLRISSASSLVYTSNCVM